MVTIIKGYTSKMQDQKQHEGRKGKNKDSELQNRIKLSCY